jgi:hypothetical protein
MEREGGEDDNMDATYFKSVVQVRVCVRATAAPNCSPRLRAVHGAIVREWF